MNTDFQLQALPIEDFQPYFAMDDAELARNSARWLAVDSEPGYPCRVSLADAKVGTRILALPFVHHDVDSPYRASGPILVTENSITAQPKINEIPAMLHHRLLSLRAYDATHMMIEAEVVKGADLKSLLHSMFGNRAVEYVHIHNANRGCYSCAALRA